MTRLFAEWGQLRQVHERRDSDRDLCRARCRSPGIYVASAIFIALFMRWLGKYALDRPCWRSRSACPSSPIFMFESWFLVPLPKGPIEDLARSSRHCRSGEDHAWKSSSICFTASRSRCSRSTSWLMIIGIVLGVIIGVLPGLGGANGVAILLPLTFTMPPTSAIIMLSCIYWGALFGGAITSILFNIPGEPWSVATTFDGYPMAQQGKAGEALTAAFTSSFVGALFAVIMITFLAPLVASFALQFGPPEFFAVYLLTFCSFVGMGKEPPFKTIASMMIGFALAAVGTRHRHRTAAPDLRLHRAAERLRLPDRRHRPVRHRRDPADDGGRPRLHAAGSAKINPQGRAADLEEAAALLDDLAALLRDRLLDGHHAGRRDAGLVHELRHRQADVAKRRRQVRQGRDRRRGRAGDRGARRRHRARCCRCSRSAFPARRPPRCCSAAC